MAADEDPRRSNMTFTLSSAVIDRLRATVYWGRGRALQQIDRGHEIDLGELPDNASTTVERALWAEILYQERILNDGSPFPAAPSGRLTRGPSRSGADRISRSRSR